MALTDRQIERYSRQIIVSEVGGLGQERLLASRINLVGEAEDIESILYYLVGAGVGRIDLRVADDESRSGAMIAHAQALNRETVVIRQSHLETEATLLIICIGGRASVALAQEFVTISHTRLTMVVRLDSPAQILIADSLGKSACRPFTRRAENAGFVAMVGAMEAVKLLSGVRPSEPKLLEFDGYATAARSDRASTRRVR
jgi:hypothetical protein